jgi:hypothetical protein
MRSVGIKLLKNRLSECFRLSPNTIALLPSLDRQRRVGWFQMPSFSMPFARDGSDRRYRLEKKFQHGNG